MNGSDEHFTPANDSEALQPAVLAAAIEGD
jgi:hypothetical protein